MGTADGMFLGELQRRVAALEAAQRLANSGRRLESASIGAGGTRYHSGGSATFEGGGGVDILDGGRQFIKGGEITAVDAEGDLIFEVDAGESPSIFMRQELIQDLAVAIFADRIRTNVVEGEAFRTSASYGNPTTGSAGPSVANVDVSEAGKAFVFLSAWMVSQTGSAFATEQTGYMSVEVSGASSVAAADANAAYLTATAVDSSGVIGNMTTVSATVTRMVLLDGLNPGSHTFTARYRRGAAADSVYVYNRALVVFAL